MDVPAASSMNWTASPWSVVMMACLGIGFAVAAWFALKIINAPKVPSDMREVRAELELACRHVINSNMQLMEACRNLSDLCKSLPDEYVVVAEQALRLAKAMEEATYAEGARDNLFPRPLFTAYEEPGTRATVPRPPPVPELPPPAPLSEPEPGAPLATVPPGWKVINGQLMKVA